MIIKNAVFVTSIADKKKLIDFSTTYDCSEICVVGRSNVGKSSFINMLAGQNKLAKTSSTPGRTRLINLFNFNSDEFMLVDLPGYGYAEASKGQRQTWGELIEGYLETTQKLVQVFALVDARHPPTVQDIQMLKYLYHFQLPFTIVATKCDKLSKAELGRNISQIATSLMVGRDNIIGVSSTTKMNRDKIIERIEEVLKNREYFDNEDNVSDEELDNLEE